MCSQKGYEIFSNKALYQKYKSDFEEYIWMAKKDIIPRFSQRSEKISLEDFLQILPILWKFWYYYWITEFPYHDFAHSKSIETGDKILTDNLDDLAKLKFEGRELLNSYVFENGVLHNILNNIGEQFLEEKTNATFLFSNDILNLYKNSKIDNSIFQQRMDYYGCFFGQNKFNIFEHSEALNVWGTLCKNEDKDKIITGRIANKGIVRGRVIIAPMLVDMKKIMEIDSRMNTGDILVAESTTPELMMLCKKACGIVTNQGGMLSHAAIVSRELSIPCVIGTENATKILQDGDIIELDANNWIVKIIQ